MMFHCKECEAVIENEVAYEVHKLNHCLDDIFDVLNDIVYEISELNIELQKRR
jgi:hypothetical protein